MGWAVGDGDGHAPSDESLAEQDAADAARLYTLLESEIIPEFYDRNANGVPQAWAARVRESMAHLTPRFSANRSVREYTESHYIPAAEAYHARAAGKGALARALTDDQHALDAAWPHIRFGPVAINSTHDTHTFTCDVALAGRDPVEFMVSLFANGRTPEDAPECVAMQIDRPHTTQHDQSDCVRLCAQIPAVRPAADYTVRLTLAKTARAMPLEGQRILWQR